MKSSIFGQNRALVSIPNRGGTGTTHYNRVGTSTDPSGTDTNASSSPDNCVLTLLSPNSYTDGIRTLINY